MPLRQAHLNAAQLYFNFVTSRYKHCTSTLEGVRGMATVGQSSGE